MDRTSVTEFLKDLERDFASLHAAFVQIVELETTELWRCTKETRAPPVWMQTSSDGSALFWNV